MTLFDPIALSVSSTSRDKKVIHGNATTVPLAVPLQTQLRPFEDERRDVLYYDVVGLAARYFYGCTSRVKVKPFVVRLRFSGAV